MTAPVAQNTHQYSRDELFQNYDYLCVNAARRYRGDPICYDDLLQIGRVGLIKAIDRYNPYLGVPFAAYAWASIIGEVRHAFRDQTELIRRPRSARHRERQARRVSERLTHQLGRAPTYGELQDALVEVVGRAPLSEPIRIAPLDAVDRAAPSLEAEIDRVVDSLALGVCMRELTELERIVVVRIYMSGADLAGLAAQLGYSTRQICRIRKNALQKLAARYVQR
ncbi:MAG: sigma-70 family RNA polymerase sigma factor [Candidatus Eremiobacteraeota bacterium]|uniref:RNA polymerase sigma-70 domain-containing protein n=1 Tax=mine drainage metagenome TaxID=410659 RepID=E6PE30_9ZZZZ|nr:sigma-70 family RNA polymerase sigma factor [Candidatus Eremiobacteraeota bacterium]